MLPHRGGPGAVLLIALLLAGFAAPRQTFAQTAVSEFVLAYGARDYSFDPLHAFSTTEAQLFTAVSEGLVTYHPLTLDPVPGVAQRWDISADGTVYRFVLRPDARYSNGSRVIAQDFRRSWLRMLDPAADAEYSFLFDSIQGARDYRTGQTTDSDRLGIRVVSNTVLEVRLGQRTDHFLKLLAHHSFSPVYPGYLGETGWEHSPSLVGNGPFRVRGIDDSRILMEKNQQYWARDTVQLDRLVVRFIDDSAQIGEEFLSGRVHWADDWSQIEQLSPFIVPTALYATSYFYFNAGAGPFSDGRVRRALALLVPWEQIRNNRIYFPTARLVPAGRADQSPPLIAQSNEREALTLLSQAGFSRGAGLPEIVLAIPSGDATAQMAQVMQDAWQGGLNVRVRIAQKPYAQFTADVQAGRFTLAYASWIGDYTDPLTFLEMWTTGSNLNDAHFTHGAYDQLLRQAQGQTGLQRLQMLTEAEGILLSQGVILPVNHLLAVNLIDQKRVAGWYGNVLDIHPFRYLGFRTTPTPFRMAALIRAAGP